MPLDPMTVVEWRTEAIRRFGPDPLNWRFACPVCHHVASVSDWKAAGATEGEAAFSCVGRWTGGRQAFGEGTGPCNYAGGGLFRLNPQPVIDEEGKTHHVFAFAPAMAKARGESDAR
jgi:hypothetical protein